MRFERITVDPDRMGGLPCIRGLRIPVATIVGMVAEGLTVEQILATTPTSRRGTSTKLCSTRPRPSERELPLRRGA
jgi:hypothetical protein